MQALRHIFLFLTLAIAAVAAPPATEIEALLRYIAGLDGASFIRNGSEHPATEAEAHLRLKWTKQTSDVATAEDFIRLCGTQSSLSGKPYLIRFKDGHEEECARVLQRQLAVIRALEKRNVPSPPGAPPDSAPAQREKSS